MTLPPATTPGLTRHDLPPKWDGCVVRWTAWQDEPEVHICPPPRERDVCPACGSIARRVLARGMVALNRNTTLERIANYERFHKAGKVAAWRLAASRCVDCRHDRVTDLHTHLEWDLDDSDYGPDGSYADGGES